MRFAHFIEHCDEPGCDLGRVSYDCPKCGRPGDDYGELWWDRLNVYDGLSLEFRCANCRAELELKEFEGDILVLERVSL